LYQLLPKRAEYGLDLFGYFFYQEKKQVASPANGTVPTFAARTAIFL